jgi:DNA-binding cell septation regulator SpoVG
MPSVQGRDGKWFDTFYPLNKEIKRTVEEQILRTYKERTGNNAAEIT